MTNCKHQILQLAPSPFAELAGYTQPSLEDRRVATASSEKSWNITTKSKDSVSTFPAPLVLPFDDLNYDPDYETQDFTKWQRLHTRNKVTASKQTIYIARVPEVTGNVKYMHDWTKPILEIDDDDDLYISARSPPVEDFIDYISAFYHGMHVKQLPLELKWTSWYAGRKSLLQRSIPKYVALQHGKETTRIRTRVPPDGIFRAQLNLNDILDGAMRILPGDAHAICLLIDHDMWEEDDDFCCGRAYGGSRVSVVQTARYNPTLDAKEGIDREHMWPLSHCKDFVDRICLTEDLAPRKPTQRQIRESRSGPMRRAVDAASIWARAAGDRENEGALWFSRLARTLATYLAVYPPPTINALPVTKLLLPPARCKTPSAISLGAPVLFIGTALSTRFSIAFNTSGFFVVIGVSI
ncbi:Archaemetzincin-1 [Didymella heteroderae]|uniref:Archaemetzincin-1 n=1 Tax=Didymella heteroderae TaxID=1769908 RepID=A0A9P4WPX8_9PLEO|nr:Archaemetzincin-1 [Didymella heteroderae]